MSSGGFNEPDVSPCMSGSTKEGGRARESSSLRPFWWSFPEDISHWVDNTDNTVRVLKNLFIRIRVLFRPKDMKVKANIVNKMIWARVVIPRTFTLDFLSVCLIQNVSVNCQINVESEDGRGLGLRASD